MAKRCWCGKPHGRGDARNGAVKHFASNWKLYYLRSGECREKPAAKGGS